jgi:hypothetical protein
MFTNVKHSNVWTCLKSYIVLGVSRVAKSKHSHTQRGQRVSSEAFAKKKFPELSSILRELSLPEVHILTQ